MELKNQIGSALTSKNPRATGNAEALQVLMAERRGQENAIRLGGGAKAAEMQRAKGRLTVRERLALLLDEGTRRSGACASRTGPTYR